MSAMVMRVALVIWLLLWARVGLPWRSFQRTPSLQHVELIPLSGGSIRSQVLNLLVFVPLGFIGMRLGWRPRTVVGIGCGVSILTEFAQLFSTRRYPSTTDFILNTVGTLIGVIVVAVWMKPTARVSQLSDSL
jgi:glycopeptide antibiotics resistance protein